MLGGGGGVWHAAAAGKLSENRSAGIGPITGAGGVLTKVRLFDSPVKLVSAQPGPLVVPVLTPVRTFIGDPLLNTAWPPLPSPKILNSISCQVLPRSGKQLPPDAVWGVPATVTVIASVDEPPHPGLGELRSPDKLKHVPRKRPNFRATRGRFAIAG